MAGQDQRDDGTLTVRQPWRTETIFIAVVVACVGRPVAPREVAKAVHCRWRACLHRLIRQIMLGQVMGRRIAAAMVFLQGLHHDPVQLIATAPWN
jgi:hypothetical protein